MTLITAGAALAIRLSEIGIDYIFANSGTDFPPIIEGLAIATERGIKVPRTVTVPHETAAMAMAHGMTHATGRAQAVMVHTNVGLANAVIGALNARADNIPMLIFSGRTPTTERGRFGSRTVPIGWGQEMMDQHALIREACKWDYELRFPEQIADLVDRAYAIANSHPKGPVYISLPREILCETIDLAPSRRPPAPAAPMAHPADIDRLAGLIAGARRPVIFAQRGAGSDAAFAALSEIAQDWGIPVCQYWALRLAVATDHPMSVASDPGPVLAEADLVILIDALAPWQPDRHQPDPDCTVVQIAQDPHFSQTPVRHFPSDLSLAGDVSENILALHAALAGHRSRMPAARATQIAEMARAQRQEADLQIDQAAVGSALTKPWISRILAQAINAENGTIVSELGAQLPAMALSHRHAWYESPHSGGLGFGLPAAMGIKLAHPERLVFSVIGDGSYIFANPVACHHVCRIENIALVVIVMNNSEWGAVRASVRDLYPDGSAVRANAVPLTDLGPSLDFRKIAEAAGATGVMVETCDAFLAALDQAIARAKNESALTLIDARIVRS